MRYENNALSQKIIGYVRDHPGLEFEQDGIHLSRLILAYLVYGLLATIMALITVVNCLLHFFSLYTTYIIATFLTHDPCTWPYNKQLLNDVFDSIIYPSDRKDFYLALRDSCLVSYGDEWDSSDEVTFTYPIDAIKAYPRLLFIPIALDGGSLFEEIVSQQAGVECLITLADQIEPVMTRVLSSPTRVEQRTLNALNRHPDLLSSIKTAQRRRLSAQFANDNVPSEVQVYPPLFQAPETVPSLRLDLGARAGY